MPLYQDTLTRDALKVVCGWLATVQEIKGYDPNDAESRLQQRLMGTILSQSLSDTLAAGKPGALPDATLPNDPRRKIIVQNDASQRGWADVPGDWQASLSYLNAIGFDKPPQLTDADSTALKAYAGQPGAISAQERQAINQILGKNGVTISWVNDPKSESDRLRELQVLMDRNRVVENEYGPMPAFAGTVRGGKIVDRGLVAMRQQYGPAPSLPVEQNDSQLINFVADRLRLLDASDTRVLIRQLAPDPNTEPDTSAAWKNFAAYLGFRPIQGPPGSREEYYPLTLASLTARAGLCDQLKVESLKRTYTHKLSVDTATRTALAMSMYIKDAVGDSAWVGTVHGIKFSDKLSTLAAEMKRFGTKTFEEHKEIHVTAREIEPASPTRTLLDFQTAAETEIEARDGQPGAPTTISEYFQRAKAAARQAEAGRYDKEKDLLQDLVLGKISLERTEKIASGQDKERKKERDKEKKEAAKK